MPLDALCLTALAEELRPTVEGARIDKIYQPTRDEAVLYLRSQAGNVRLLLSARPGSPRAHLTTLVWENPDKPPMFCMLLRKHLQGARILALEQPPLERILVFRLEVLDELGDRVERRLVLECMGRSANLILLDGGAAFWTASAGWRGTWPGASGSCSPACSTGSPRKATS